MQVPYAILSQPEFHDNDVDGEADPECRAKELLHCPVREARRGEEDTHHRPSGSDS